MLNRHCIKIKPCSIALYCGAGYMLWYRGSSVAFSWVLYCKEAAFNKAQERKRRPLKKVYGICNCAISCINTVFKLAI